MQMHPGVPPSFPPAKKGGFNFVSQRKVIDYYATAVKTLEVSFSTRLHKLLPSTIDLVLEPSVAAR